MFLDRDGVINENLENDYVKTWGEFKFIPKAREALKALTEAGWDVIVISNQAGIGKGIVSAQAVERINKRMMEEIERCGGRIKEIYYCPHRPDENCECRKPKPGMLFRAARESGIELSESYLIGDKISDIQAGAQAGCKTILVKTGLGEEYIRKRKEWPLKPDYIECDLSEAVELLLKLSKT